VQGAHLKLHALDGAIARSPQQANVQERVELFVLR